MIITRTNISKAVYLCDCPDLPDFLDMKNKPGIDTYPPKDWGIGNSVSH